MKTLHLSIIVIVISFGTYYGFAQYPAISYSGPTNDLGNGSLLSITTTKNVFSAGDIIDIHGNSLPNYHVELTLIGPNGTIQDSRPTFSDRDGQFSSYLLIPKYAQGGTWKIFGKSGTYNAELDFDIFEPQSGQTCHGCFLGALNSTKPIVESKNVVESPLKQFKSGIVANNVKCKQDLQLVIKSEAGSPVCVKPKTAQKFVERGWGWAMQTINSIKPLLPNRIIGLENDTGIVTLENQTYYFETPNYTDTAYFNHVQISFHNIFFTLFPAGFRGGLPIPCSQAGSGQYYWVDAKFPNDAHELLHIFAWSQPCTNSIPTMFSNHTNPKAGLTFYDGKMKLLVSTDNQTANPLGIAALIEYTPIDMGLGTGPNYHFYLKINSNSTAYLLGYNICGKDFCVKNNNLSILIPKTNIGMANYTRIGLSENLKWNYGDTTDIQLEISPTTDNKTAYFLNVKNSTIVP